MDIPGRAVFRELQQFERLGERLIAGGNDLLEDLVRLAIANERAPHVREHSLRETEPTEVLVRTIDPREKRIAHFVLRRLGRGIAILPEVDQESLLLTRMHAGEPLLDVRM